MLRGARYPGLWTPLTRRVTEPGQMARLGWVLAQFHGSGPQRVLDAGCGEGTFTVALAGRGHHLTALDFSDSMLAATRRRAAAARVSGRVRLLHADLRYWSSPERFDTVLCMGVADYYPESPELLARLFSITDRLLISLSRWRPGLRSLVRRAWLRCNGLPCRTYDRDQLEPFLQDLLRADVEFFETRWTHCVAARRR